MLCFFHHSNRQSEDQSGKRLGKHEHLGTKNKPQRPTWMDKKTYQVMPKTLTIREIKDKKRVIVITVVEPKIVTKKEVIDLYSSLRNIEIDLKFIKEILQMDMSQSQTPEMVRKEIGVHLLAYNLIRTVMAQAACLYNIS